MNAKLPRSIAVGFALTICLMVFVGIAITQPTNGAPSLAKVGENA